MRLARFSMDNRGAAGAISAALVTAAIPAMLAVPLPAVANEIDPPQWITDKTKPSFAYGESFR